MFTLTVSDWSSQLSQIRGCITIIGFYTTGSGIALNESPSWRWTATESRVDKRTTGTDVNQKKSKKSNNEYQTVIERKATKLQSVHRELKGNGT